MEELNRENEGLMGRVEETADENESGEEGPGPPSTPSSGTDAHPSFD